MNSGTITKLPKILKNVSFYQERHPDLFYTCIDMLGLILHSLGGGDNAVHDVMGIPAGCTKVSTVNWNFVAAISQPSLNF